ncbi:MAG: DEAD/DEAH box helicase, partial [archaeon]|nr:DEAD/DEAH box helicase [archaeon]
EPNIKEEEYENFEMNKSEDDEDNFDQNKKNKKKAKGFRQFHLTEELYSGIKNIGYKNPTPIQKKVIPEILSGFNIVAHSRTGSGKTASFLLPALSKLKEHSKIVGVRCLILSPTRELAHQTANFCKKLGKFTNLRFALLVGGNELESQFEKLAQNPDIIIATPGRVLHHIDEGSLSLKKIEILIIDEADKMMELNFESQLKDIIKQSPSEKQIILISATIQAQLSSFIKNGLIKEYKTVHIDEENKIPDKLKIHLLYTRKEEKIFSFISLFKEGIIDLTKQLTITFVMTKYHCEYLQEFLKYYDIPSLIIYGQMDQQMRNKNLEDFKKGRIKLLIVTDIAARGLDIPLLDNVINYDFPDTQKLFIHRVGRTARANKSGINFNLCSVDDLAYFFDVKYYLGKEFKINATNEEDLTSDFNSISFGSVPDRVINKIKEERKTYLFDSKLDINTLYDTMNKAEIKARTFRQNPSQYGIKQGKILLNEFEIKVHPFYKEKYEDEEKQKFLSELKHFKPKENYFDKLRETSVNTEKMNIFKAKAEEYKKKKDLEKEREKKKKEDIEIKKEDLNEEEDIKMLGKKIKRSKMKNFKNSSQYISDVKDEKNQKSLWGKEKPIELDELTLNINTDDTMNARKKTVWNEKKKKFVTAKVDQSGNIINESGKTVKKNENYHPYKNWKRKSKMAIQTVGEIEKNSTINTAKELFRERKQAKNNKGKNEVKQFQQILKEKKKKFKEFQKKNKMFSKKALRESQMKNRQHLNARSQTFIKTKISSKSKGKFRNKRRR